MSGFLPGLARFINQQNHATYLFFFENLCENLKSRILNLKLKNMSGYLLGLGRSIKQQYQTFPTPQGPTIYLSLENLKKLKYRTYISYS